MRGSEGMEGTPEAQRGGVPAGVGTEVPWETAGHSTLLEHRQPGS